MKLADTKNHGIDDELVTHPRPPRLRQVSTVSTTATTRVTHFACDTMGTVSDAPWAHLWWKYLVGGFKPSENLLVIWDDESPNRWKNNPVMFQENQQPDMIWIRLKLWWTLNETMSVSKPWACLDWPGPFWMVQKDGRSPCVWYFGYAMLGDTKECLSDHVFLW